MGKHGEAYAQAEAWNYAFGEIKNRVLKTAVQLEIPDLLENNGGAVSLSALSSVVGCPSEPLHRIMRFLIHNGIFKKEPLPSDTCDVNSPPSIYYVQKPLSRLFTKDKMVPFMLLHGTLSGNSGGITVEALRTGKRLDLKDVNGDEKWTDQDLSHAETFTKAMTAHARVTAVAIINNYPEAFNGIRSLVDVGSRHGMALSLLVAAFPWVRGIAFDMLFRMCILE